MVLRFLLCALLLAAPAHAGEGPVGPRLGAATNFGQSWFPQYISGAERLPLALYRDEMFWSGIERPDGSFVFDNERTRYPHVIEALERDLMFIVNNGHPAYDNGDTPVSDAAVAAFANYAATLVETYPAITTLEIGNEMNSETFANGPGWSADLATRAASYARLARATAEAVRATRPEVRILGGAAHSIPIAWFREIYSHDLDGLFDAVVIHPYTVPPEQLARQIALLRSEVPALRDMPLSVTEFGEDDAQAAPAYLMKFYCQMALSGVESAVWYPLNPRGDGLSALLNEDGSVTSTGEAFRTAVGWFEGRDVLPYRPDPFTYGCQFGSDTLLMWGEPRDVAIADYVDAYDIFGARMDRAGLRLSMETPLILRAIGRRFEPARAVRLGRQALIADSYHQFAFPGQAGDVFERLVRQNGRELALIAEEGQQRGGVPWTPYLGSDLGGLVRATASWALPSRPASGAIEIVYRYRADRPRVTDAAIWIAPSADTQDGVTVSVEVNGRRVARETVLTPRWLVVPGLDLRAGDAVDFVLGPNNSDAGDFSHFRVQLRKPAS